MNEDTDRKRRPYQKPQVEQVELVAEEQVLGGCKTESDGGGAGAVSGNCTLQVPQCVLETGT